VPTIEVVTTPDDYAEAGRLIRAYLDSLPFEVTFQDVDVELRELPQRYGPPKGIALLARHAGRAIGVVALKDLGEGICEMKRLYVEPGARGLGAGRMLVEAIVDEGRRLGYDAMRLDTYPPAMQAAGAMYQRLGFVDIPNYNGNPIAGVRFMELRL
jgi:GNAT superfamily N-acetyltransferase